jgi:2'-5' RNA ligase
MLDPRPLIVTALFEPAVQARFEALRRAHYPAALNRVPAHLTLFRQLPGREIDAVRRRLKMIAAQVPPPRIDVTGLQRRDAGVAITLRAPDLADVRDELAAGFAGLLIPQDQAGFAGHVTVQNKVTPAQARATHAQLAATFTPFTTRAVALTLWRYCDGPWETLGSTAFRGRS